MASTWRGSSSVLLSVHLPIVRDFALTVKSKAYLYLLFIKAYSFVGQIHSRLIRLYPTQASRYR